MNKVIRCLANPGEAIYRIQYKKGKTVPIRIASMIHKLNMPAQLKQYGHSYLHFSSYDGSGQLTHPSAVTYKGREYLTATPFPYSINTYENPCVYVQKSETEYEMIHGPIEYPESSGKDYLNDPCLYTDEELIIFYRHTFVESGRETKNLLMLSKSFDGLSWSKPTILLRDGGDTLLSPAVIYLNNQYILFYVKKIDEEYHIMQRSGTMYNLWREEHRCQILGLPEDYMVWHISVSKIDGILKGLFTVRNKFGEYKLFLTDYSETLNWVVDKEIKLREIDYSKIRITYKSTFCQDGSFIIAVRDDKNRWALIRQKGVEI